MKITNKAWHHKFKGNGNCYHISIRNNKKRFPHIISLDFTLTNDAVLREQDNTYSI